MNYRHNYHAGNFADVLKHIVLIGLLKSFFKKESPFCYIDTHAGTGLYNFYSAAAQKSKEYENGIKRVIEGRKPPALVQEYITCTQHLGKIYYPGSPKIAEYYLRKQDRIILSELHPEDFKKLKDNFSDAKNTSVQQQNGYQSLKAFLPPKEKRGLILIDPPYEKNTEFSDILEHLKIALKKFETGVYAVWYPIKDRASITRFHQQLKQITSREILIVELSLYPEDLSTHLNGSGVFIINPPYQLDELLKETLPWLAKTLSVGNRSEAYCVKDL